MDTGTNIIGLSFLLFCLVIFIIISRNHRKKEKKLLLLLEGLAAKNNCKIVQHDIWNNAAIGIDYGANRLFAVRNTTNQPQYFEVALSEIQKCGIIKGVSISNDIQDKFKVIQRLGLSFAYRDKHQQELIIDFYNADESAHALDGELHLVEKWQDLINNRAAFLQLKL